MKNILVVKIGAIGDVAMTTSLLPAIRRLHPGVPVTWIVGRQAAPVLEAVDAEVELVRVDDRALLAGTLWQRMRELARLAAWFRFRRFSLALVPYFDRRYLSLLAGVRAQEVRAFWQKRRTVPGRHHCVNYIRLLDRTDGGSADFPAPPSPGELYGDMPEFPPLRPEIVHSGAVPDVLIVPGGARNILADNALRRWPLEHYTALAAMLLEAGFSVGLIGGSGDEWAREAFAGLAVTDFIGRLALKESLALLAKARLLVTHDTGPLHLMGLARGKIVALMGPTAPAELGPLRNAIVLRAPGYLPCRPCYDGKRFAGACASPLCMRGITPDMAFQAAVRQLA